VTIDLATLAAFVAHLPPEPSLDDCGVLCDWLEEQGATVRDLLPLYARDELPQAALAQWCRKTEPEEKRPETGSRRWCVIAGWRLDPNVAIGRLRDMRRHDPIATRSRTTALIKRVQKAIGNGYQPSAGDIWFHDGKAAIDYACLELKRAVLRLFPEVLYTRSGYIKALQIVPVGTGDDGKPVESAEFANKDTATLGFLPDTVFDWRRMGDGLLCEVTQTLTPEQALLPAEPEFRPTDQPWRPLRDATVRPVRRRDTGQLRPSLP
jgi:hypothetical protein